MAYGAASDGSGSNPFAFLRDDPSLSWQAKAQTWDLLTDNGTQYPSSVEQHADGSTTFHYTDFDGNPTGSRTLTQGDGGLEISRTEGALGSGQAGWTDKAGWSGSESLTDGSSSTDLGASVGGSASGSLASGSADKWWVDGGSGTAQKLGAQGEVGSGSIGGSVGTGGGELGGSAYVGKGELSGSMRSAPSAEPRDLTSDTPKDIVFGQADGKVEIGLGGKMGGSLDSSGPDANADLVFGADANVSAGTDSMGNAWYAGIFSDSDRSEIVSEVQGKQLRWMNGPGGGRNGMQRKWDQEREQVLASDHLTDAQKQDRLDKLDKHYGDPIRRHDALTGSDATTDSGSAAAATDGAAGGMSEASAPEPWSTNASASGTRRASGTGGLGQADFSSLFESISGGLERVRNNIP